MKTTRDLSIIGVFTAMLIGGQFALSGVTGVEVVTILLLAYCISFGIVKSIVLVNLFTVLRCIVFGFFPNVFILYLIYYNLFAVTFGFIGNRFKHSLDLKKHVFIVLLACVFTVAFTFLDDLITPLFYGYGEKATRTYFYMSFTALVPQLICTIVTVTFLLIPLNRVLTKAVSKV